MIISTALLVRERGARATSIDDVLQHSGAPRGSVYHHFPGGRQQLLREATEFAGAAVGARLERLGDRHPIAALERFIDGYRIQLESHGFRAGCPVVAVAVEAPEEDAPDDLLGSAADAFAHWQAVMARQYAAHGATPERADELAMIVVAAVEGALVLCQARRDTTALDVVRRQLRTLLEAELDPEESP